ncbi:MAG: hypothetical protein K2Y29_00515 [Beijerinckiaceae bacterium]|nr:hypothetical protein [Beijerinckiaceae bacterium]
MKRPRIPPFAEMTLEDYFAGQALAGLIAGGHYDAESRRGHVAIAFDAYCIAEALLKNREIGEEVAAEMAAGRDPA